MYCRSLLPTSLLSFKAQASPLFTHQRLPKKYSNRRPQLSLAKTQIRCTAEAAGGPGNWDKWIPRECPTTFLHSVDSRIKLIVSGMMIPGLSLTLGTLLGWHIYLVIHNMTTIEYYEDIRAAWLARKSGQSYRHPFDVGAYKNITLVFGPNMLKWLCPTAVSHLKDGIAFPTTRDNS